MSSNDTRSKTNTSNLVDVEHASMVAFRCACALENAKISYHWSVEEVPSTTDDFCTQTTQNFFEFLTEDTNIPFMFKCTALQQELELVVACMQREEGARMIDVERRRANVINVDLLKNKLMRPSKIVVQARKAAEYLNALSLNALGPTTENASPPSRYLP